MQVQEHQIKKMKLMRRIIASLSFLLIIVSYCLLLSCQTSTVSDKPYVYIVKSGDSLQSIAEDAQITPEMIINFNALELKTLSSGQILLLPGVHELQHGTKLQRIDILERNIWGANQGKKMNPAGSFNKITVHHTTEKQEDNKRNDIHFIQTIQKYHQKTKGWADIGYHFILGKDGKIYEGRLLSFQGAHVRNHNKGNIGIAILGDLNKHQLSKIQRESLSALIEALQEKYDIDEKNIFAHRELGNTSCPGDHTMTFLKEFRD